MIQSKADCEEANLRGLTGAVMRESKIDNEREHWSSSLKAGFMYFMIVFGVGFLLGTFRVFLLVPAIGETPAVALEGPIILAASWFSSLWLIRKFGVFDRLASRLATGLFAFALLMVGEVGVSIFGYGRTFDEHLASYRSVASILGMTGQLAFAIFPAIQLAVRRQGRRQG